MSKRLLFAAATLGLCLLPFGVMADDVLPPTDTPVPAATDTPAPAPQAAPNSAAQLGPAANSGQTGSSSADSGTLQGASTTPLQSTTNDSSGLTAPSSPLQAPASSDETLRVIMGESDGNPHNLADDAAGKSWAWLAWSLLIAGIVVVTSMVMRRYGAVRVPFPKLRFPQLRQARRRPH